jgi:hypothetical protein
VACREDLSCVCVWCYRLAFQRLTSTGRTWSQIQMVQLSQSTLLTFIPGNSLPVSVSCPLKPGFFLYVDPDSSFYYTCAQG